MARPFNDVIARLPACYVVVARARSTVKVFFRQLLQHPTEERASCATNILTPASGFHPRIIPPPLYVYHCIVASPRGFNTEEHLSLSCTLLQSQLNRPAQVRLGGVTSLPSRLSSTPSHPRHSTRCRPLCRSSVLLASMPENHLTERGMVRERIPRRIGAESIITGHSPL